MGIIDITEKQLDSSFKHGISNTFNNLSLYYFIPSEARCCRSDFKNLSCVQSANHAWS